MGVYDGYRDAQLKVGPCVLKQYDVGDKVPIEDGVYVAWEGAVVINNGVFIATFDHLFSKWGAIIKPEEILAPHDYVGRAVEAIAG